MGTTIKGVAVLYRVHCPVTGRPIQMAKTYEYSDDRRISQAAGISYGGLETVRSHYVTKHGDYEMYAIAYLFLDSPVNEIRFDKDIWTDIPSWVHAERFYLPN